MTKESEDVAWEERIQMEIVVDAYDPEERAIGWYYYLQGQLQFPFLTHCVAKRATSQKRRQEAAGF